MSGRAFNDFTIVEIPNEAKEFIFAAAVDAARRTRFGTITTSLSGFPKDRSGRKTHRLFGTKLIVPLSLNVAL